MSLHSAQPFPDIKLFQNCLLLRHWNIEIGRQEIRELLRVIDIADNGSSFLRHIWSQLRKPRRAVAQILELSPPFAALLRYDRLRQIDLSPQIGLGRHDFSNGKASQALHYDHKLVLSLPQQF